MLSFMTFFIALQLIAANSDTAIYNFLTIPDIFDANIRMQLSMTDPEVPFSCALP